MILVIKPYFNIRFQQSVNLYGKRAATQKELKGKNKPL